MQADRTVIKAVDFPQNAERKNYYSEIIIKHLKSQRLYHITQLHEPENNLSRNQLKQMTRAHS